MEKIYKNWQEHFGASGRKKKAVFDLDENDLITFEQKLYD